MSLISNVNKLMFFGGCIYVYHRQTSNNPIKPESLGITEANKNLVKQKISQGLDDAYAFISKKP